MKSTQLLSVSIKQISAYVSRKVSMNVENKITTDFYDQIMMTDWESWSRFHTDKLLGIVLVMYPLLPQVY